MNLRSEEYDHIVCQKPPDLPPPKLSLWEKFKGWKRRRKNRSEYRVLVNEDGFYPAVSSKITGSAFTWNFIEHNYEKWDTWTWEHKHHCKCKTEMQAWRKIVRYKRHTRAHWT